MTARKIVTDHVYPPIPLRTMDWCAYYDGTEEDGRYGWGRTEQAAIDDLLAQEDEEDSEPAQPTRHRMIAGYRGRDPEQKDRS